MRACWALWLTGCATSGSFQTARTVGPGGWELGADASAVALVDAGSDDAPWLVLPRIHGRVGASERTEIQASAGLDGFKVGPRVQLTEPDSTGVIVTAGVSAKVLPIPGDPGGVLLGPEETVYLGVPLPDSELVVLARSAQDVGFVDGNRATLVWAGGALGWSWTPDGRFRLMPEVGVMTPVWVTDDGDSTGARGAVVSLGLGLAYGQRR